VPAGEEESESEAGPTEASKAITDLPSEMAMRAAVERLTRRAEAGESPSLGPSALSPSALVSWAGEQAAARGAAGGWPLADAWRRWTDLVASLSEGLGHGTWDKASYQRLHAGLLASCRCEAAARPEGRAWFARLEAVVRPWVSLESLETTEPELLKSLLAQCQQADPGLAARPAAPPNVMGWLRVCVIPPVVVWLIVQAAAAGWRLWSAGVAGWDFRGLVSALQLDSLPGQVYLVLPIIVLAALLLIRPRSL
jgi:hypothetical protein